jgi:sulfoxide reductase heme-binding subunit YedZ
VKQKQIVWLKVVVHIACLIPLALLGWDFYKGQLGANPIEVITHSTGSWTLNFLLITLSVTPLRVITGQPWLVRFRRMFGLYAFFYACLHFSTYIWLDKFFDWTDITKDVAKRPFITVGFAAFLTLIPLALTSTKAAVRILSGRRWQLLHRLVYLAAILGVIHYLWLVKADIRAPVTYGIILAALLVYRLVVAVRWPARPWATL